MVQITRQQLCAELGISESIIRRFELAGLPFTPIGKRTKRYDVEECKAWLRNVHRLGEHVHRLGEHVQSQNDAEMRKRCEQFIASCRNIKLRVNPS